MSYINLARSRLGTLQDNSQIHPLKSDIAMADADNLHLIIFAPKEEGKRRIINAYSVRGIVSSIEKFMTKNSDKSKKDYIGFKRRLRLAKNAVLENCPGLSAHDIDIAVQIAQERYEDTYLYKRRHREVKPEDMIEVLVDECISYRMAHLFDTDLTMAFAVQASEHAKSKDHTILKLARGGILVTEDDDLVHAVRMIYVERVKNTGRSNIDMSDMPFIVHIESSPEKSQKYKLVQKKKRGDERLSEPHSSPPSSDIQIMQAQIRRASIDFEDSYKNSLQIHQFAIHLKEIIRLTDNSTRPHLGLIIRRNGNIDYLCSRDRYMDMHFGFLPEDFMAQQEPDQRIDEYKGCPVVTIDGNLRIYNERADGKTKEQIFDKINLYDSHEICELTFANDEEPIVLLPSKRFGQQAPYARRLRESGRHHRR